MARQVETLVPDDVTPKPVRRLTWHSSDALMPLMLAYFSPERIHLRENGSDAIVPEESEVPRLGRSSATWTCARTRSERSVSASSTSP